MHRATAAAALILATIALGAQAQPQTLKPGLWEISNTMQSGSGEMEKAMAQMKQEMESMPPEQRKMMQDMMAKQGVGIGAGAAGAMTVKICMTKEMIERNEIGAQEGDCKTSHSPWVGNTMKMSFTCTKPPSSGDGQISVVSPQAYNVKMTVNTTSKGKPERMAMDGKGKWLSAECGAIKPLGTPKK